MDPMFWYMVASLVISSYISYRMSQRIEKPPPAALEDFEAPTAEEGRPIPVVFGTVTVKGQNVLWYGDLGVEPIEGEGGKK